MAKKLVLNAIELEQPTRLSQMDSASTKSLYLTTIKIGDLLDKSMFQVNWWDNAKKNRPDQGYQRQPEESRKKKISSYLVKVKNSIFPTNIVISSHKPILFKKSTGNIGTIELNDYPVWILDGQNRVEGFRYAVDEANLGTHETDRILSYEMPVTILSNYEIIDELDQFYILNSTQKRVKTDLAQRLRKMIVDKYGLEEYEEMGDLYGKNSWEFRAMAVIDLLNTEGERHIYPSIWSQRVQLPNVKKSYSHLVRQNSFVTSLKPLFYKGVFETVGKEDKATYCYNALKNYWDALAFLFPDAFKLPKEYVIQKTPGIFSLHSLANTIFNMLLTEHKELNKDNIIEKLKVVFNDEKYTSDFWRADGNGAAQAGSMKGFGRLADEFKSNLI